MQQQNVQFCSTPGCKPTKHVLRQSKLLKCITQIENLIFFMKF